MGWKHWAESEYGRDASRKKTERPSPTGSHKFVGTLCGLVASLWTTQIPFDQMPCSTNPHMRRKAQPVCSRRPDRPAPPRAPCELPVQDKQSELGPSASPRPLTSASVKQSEATLAPDKFYKTSAPTPGLKQAHLLFPQGLFRQRRPLSQALLAVSLGLNFYFKKEFCWYQLLQRQNPIAPNLSDGQVKGAFLDGKLQNMSLCVLILHNLMIEQHHWDFWV